MAPITPTYKSAIPPNPGSTISLSWWEPLLPGDGRDRENGLSKLVLIAGTAGLKKSLNRLGVAIAGEKRHPWKTCHRSS